MSPVLENEGHELIWPFCFNCSVLQHMRSSDIEDSVFETISMEFRYIYCSANFQLYTCGGNIYFVRIRHFRSKMKVSFDNLSFFEFSVWMGSLTIVWLLIITGSSSIKWFSIVIFIHNRTLCSYNTVLLIYSYMLHISQSDWQAWTLFTGWTPFRPPSKNVFENK